MMRGGAGGTTIRFLALVLVGGGVGFLVSRLLPLALERGVVFAAVPILLIAILLSLRALRRTRRSS